MSDDDGDDDDGDDDDGGGDGGPDNDDIAVTNLFFTFCHPFHIPHSFLSAPCLLVVRLT